MFTPTFLYIKRHSLSGKFYLGKTIRHNPEKYLGSGTRWRRHIRKYGEQHVETVWYCLFLDESSCTEFALLISNLCDVANSQDWLNLIPENGLRGQSKGYKPSNEARLKMRRAKLGKSRPPQSQEQKQKHSLFMKGHQVSVETREKISNKLTGTKLSQERCSNISKALKGRKRVFTEAHKANMSAARKRAAEFKRELKLVEETKITS